MKTFEYYIEHNFWELIHRAKRGSVSKEEVRILAEIAVNYKTLAENAERAIHELVKEKEHE